MSRNMFINNINLMSRPVSSSSRSRREYIICIWNPLTRSFVYYHRTGRARALYEAYSKGFPGCLVSVYVKSI